jgi:hypothetical protein
MPISTNMVVCKDIFKQCATKFADAWALFAAGPRIFDSPKDFICGDFFCPSLNCDI